MLMIRLLWCRTAKPVSCRKSRCLRTRVARTWSVDWFFSEFDGLVIGVTLFSLRLRIRSVLIVDIFVARVVLVIRMLSPTVAAFRCCCANETRPKLHKYPDGYPGDIEPPLEMPQRSWRKPRHRVRYTCHLCSTLYRSGERHCSGCGQEKGPHTIRDPYVLTRPKLTAIPIERQGILTIE